MSKKEEKESLFCSFCGKSQKEVKKLSKKFHRKKGDVGMKNRQGNKVNVGNLEMRKGCDRIRMKQQSPTSVATHYNRKLLLM